MAQSSVVARSKRQLRAVLKRGGVLAVPTESSYALAADPRDRDGVALVYRIKRRSADRPLPVLIADREQLDALGVVLSGALSERLASLWPAALSLVLPLRHDLPAAATGDTLAVRVPDHPSLVRLMRGLGRPLTGTSLNRSGQSPILEPEQARSFLAGYDARVVDGGRLEGGLPSTLVRVGGSGIQVLREGRVSLDELRRSVGPDVEIQT